MTAKQSHRQLLTVTLLAFSLCCSLMARAADTAKDDDFFEFDDKAADVSIADPLESVNRFTFAFNDKMYRYAMKPIARGLRVLPDPVLKSFANFFSNLKEPVSAISALLEGQPRNAASEIGRFVLNSTVGLFGFLDPATEVGLVEDDEDIGQAMATWGVGHGFYLVVPFYGSSSLRDITGDVATSALNPMFRNLETGEVIGITFTSAEVRLALDKDSYEGFYANSLDPYIFFRTAWLQNREGKIRK